MTIYERKGIKYFVRLTLTLYVPSKKTVRRLQGKALHLTGGPPGCFSIFVIPSPGHHLSTDSLSEPWDFGPEFSFVRRRNITDLAVHIQSFLKQCDRLLHHTSMMVQRLGFHAALGSDGVSDVMPSRVEAVAMPIHTVAIVAMGLHLLDNLELSDLSVACAEEQRWSFLLTIAPLVLHRGTASPVNPIALF